MQLTNAGRLHISDAFPVPTLGANYANRLPTFHLNVSTGPLVNQMPGLWFSNSIAFPGNAGEEEGIYVGMVGNNLQIENYNATGAIWFSDATAPAGRMCIADGNFAGLNGIALSNATRIVVPEFAQALPNTAMIGVGKFNTIQTYRP